MRSQQGAAYVLALVTLLVGSILAFALLRAAGVQYLAEQTRSQKRAARNMAEAGIDYAFWKVHCKCAGLPYSADVTLSTGSFHVDVTDDGSRDSSSMLIVSKGTSGRHTCTIKKVALGPLPYQYCWCESSAVDDGDILLASGSGRGIRSNGKVKLSHAFTSLTNGGWAATVFEGTGTVSPKYTSTPPVRFPDIDFAYYASIANYTFGSPSKPTTLSITSGMQSGGGVVLVYGDITNIQGISYVGNWTVIATHDITVTCPVMASDSNSYLTLIAGHNINISTSGSFASDRLDAVVYAPSGVISLRGDHYLIYKDNDLYINGALAANDISTSGDGASLVVHLAWDQRLTTYVLRDKLRMPGL